MEYCTLLGHLLYIDLAVYFAALRTFAHFLHESQEFRAYAVAMFSNILIRSIQVYDLTSPDKTLSLFVNNKFMENSYGRKI